MKLVAWSGITTPMHADRRKLIGYDSEVICSRSSEPLDSFKLSVRCGFELTSSNFIDCLAAGDPKLFEVRKLKQRNIAQIVVQRSVLIFAQSVVHP